MVLNNVQLIGRLANDVDLQYTNGGRAVANFTLAVNRPFGNKENNADFIRVVLWDRQAENVNNYCKKGSQIAVVGRINTGKYNDKETGKTVYTTDVSANYVQFLNIKNDNNNKQQEENTNEPANQDFHPF